MNTGNNKVQIRLVEITIPHFNISNNYENTVLTEKEVAWMAGWDFWAERKSEEWTQLITQSIITMKRKDNGKKIAELTVRSYFDVTPGLATEHKLAVLERTINQTMAHAQGAWTVMNTNPCIAAIIPQSLEQFNKDSEEVKNMLKRKWGKWTNK